MPTLGVDVGAIEAGRVVPTRREDFGIWCLPGGVDAGESVTHVAIREVREETGLDVRLTHHSSKKEATMALPPMTMTDNPAQSDRTFLDGRIYAYNVASTGIADGRMLLLTVRDERQAIIAGLSGWTWGGCMEIEYLWVREDQRAKGLGTALLAAAEAEGITRGCTHVVLDTHSFQAPEFYKKHGYAAYSAVDEYPRGFSYIHLRKQLQ